MSVSVTRVLVIPNPNEATDNPYLTTLCRELASNGAAITNSAHGTRRDLISAVKNPPSILHIHWPELIVAGSLVSAVVCVSAIAAIKLRGTLVVQTVHNIHPHNPVSLLRGCLLGVVDLLTDQAIYLSDFTRDQAKTARRKLVKSSSLLIRHHRYEVRPSGDELGEGLLAIGAFRPYKRFEDIIKGFLAADVDESLTIVGRPSDSGYVKMLQERAEMACASGKHVQVHAEHVTDRVLEDLLHECRLVVIASFESANSGVAYLAISSHRPILAPDTESFRELAATLPGWVTLYTKESGSLSRGMERAPRRGEGTSPSALLPSAADVAETILESWRQLG